MTRLSLRARVTAVATVAVAVVLLLAGALLLHALRVGITNRIDALLRADTALVSERSLDGERIPTAAIRNRLVQVVDADGNVVWSSPGAGADDAAPLLGAPLPWAADSGPHTVTVHHPDLGELRVRATPFGPDRQQWLVVARSQELATTARRAVVRAELVGVPLLTLGLGVVVWLGVGRALRPVEDIRATVGEITERHLSTRVPVPATGDEVARLATTMNEMLDRLDAASMRERQLVADASHELRSPLASVRALLETRDASPDPAAHDAEAMAAVIRLQSLVDQLLELASQDADVPVPNRPVDLDDLVLERAAGLGTATGLTVDTQAVSAGQVLGSEEGLRRVVDNLLGNAARHARSRVRVELREADGWVQLVVADDGAGIPAGERTRVFDRFTRLDDARTHDRSGAGLGLAIVAGVVARHHGSVAVDADPALGGARFVVQLPAAPDPTAPTAPTGPGAPTAPTGPGTPTG